MLPGRSRLSPTPLSPLPIQPLSAPPWHRSPFREGDQDAPSASQTAAQRHQRNSHFGCFWCLTSPTAGRTPQGCCLPPSTTPAAAEQFWQRPHTAGSPSTNPGTNPCHGGRGEGLLATAEQRGGKASSAGGEEKDRRTGQPGYPQIFLKTQRQRRFPVGRAAMPTMKPIPSEQGNSS